VTPRPPPPSSSSSRRSSSSSDPPSLPSQTQRGCHAWPLGVQHLAKRGHGTPISSLSKVLPLLHIPQTKGGGACYLLGPRRESGCRGRARTPASKCAGASPLARARDPPTRMRGPNSLPKC
jgi:hypothetical protein